MTVEPVRRRTPWLLAGAVAAAYALAALLLHHRLRSTGYDLGIFSQSVDHWSQLGWPVSPLKNAAEGLPLGTNLLTDHVSPIMALLAVPWWIWPHPETLLVAQSLLLGAACVPVWRFAQRRLGARAATGATLALALSGSIQATGAFDVHEVAFAVPLVALAIERADAGRWRAAIAATLALLLVKEDLGLLVAAMGIVAALAGRRRLGLAVGLAGLAGSALAIGVVMPAAGGAFHYWTYNQLGPDAPSALQHVLAHPVDTLRVALSPWPKVGLLAWLFASLSAFSLLSPLVLLAVPLLAELLLSDRTSLVRTDTHYTAVLATVLTLAACDGLSRLLRRRADSERRGPLARRIAYAGVVVAVAQGLTLGTRSLAAIGDPHSYVLDAHAAAGRAALAEVPAGAPVVTATNRLVPHLLGHSTLRLLSPMPVPAGWLVADTAEPDYPLLPAEVRARAAALVAAGWTMVSDRGGFVVLHAPGLS